MILIKKLITGFAFCLFSIAILTAQPISVSTPDAMKKAADQAIEEGNPYAALEFYQKIDKESKEKEIDAKLAELYYATRWYEKAERKLGRLVTRDRKKQWTEYKYLYAMTLKAVGNYQEAMGMFEDYAMQGADEEKVARCKLEIEGIKMAKKLKAPDNLAVAFLGKNVSSAQTEASPSYSEGVLYYSSVNGKDVIEVKSGEDWEAKIFTSTPGGEGFAKGAALDQNINREGYHQGNVHVTADGKVMYFTRVLLEGQEMIESKIFYARNQGGEWGAANEVTGVNGDYIAKHPVMGELYGERVMFFVAEIPGGQGGDDIYYAPRKEDGLFGAPVNLGEDINTANDEATPFYMDGKLYFSSDGYPSMGGMDVYSSAWNGSKWSAPANQGPGINTAQDDMYFSIAKDGKSGFLVSNREGGLKLKGKYCCDDMYAWELEQVKVTLNALTYRFKTRKEKKSRKIKENPALTECTVQLYDVTDKSPDKTDTKTNKAGNDFQFTLYPEKQYEVIVSRKGFQNDTLEFNTVGVTRSKVVNKKVTLRRERKKPPVATPPTTDSVVVSINEPIRLNNIYYDYNDDKILQDAEQDLYVILGLLNQYPDMVIELSSHTDSRGKIAYNQDLSQRRANSARQWLIGQGIAGERIVPKGYGEEFILNQCTEGVKCTDDEHRFNRRTEFKIIAGPTTITIKKMEVRERSSGAGGGGKNSWNSDIYEILTEMGYYPVDTIVPAGAGEENMFENVFENESAHQAPPVGSLSEKSESAQSKIMAPSTPKPKLDPAVEAYEAAAAVMAQKKKTEQVAVENTWNNPADALMTFNTKVYDFGTIKEGEKAEKLFMLTNIDEAALIIEVVSACDCMQTDYTRTMIEKGEKGNIQVVFDSNGQKGKVDKTIDIIFANEDKDGYPLIQQLKVVGTVE